MRGRTETREPPMARLVLGLLLLAVAAAAEDNNAALLRVRGGGRDGCTKLASELIGKQASKLLH